MPVDDPSGRRDADGPIVIGRRLAIDPAQADIIRQIFRWYIDGVSHPRMADRLNAMGAPPPRGPRWTRHHLQRMLQNERYRGRAIWGQQVFERRPGTNRKVARRRPRDRWHVVDRPELRIVDDDLWQRAQARRASVRASLKLDAVTGRARGRTGLYSKHLLVGLSQCGVCGKGFTVISSRHGSPRYGCHQSWHNGLTACANRLTVMAKVADPRILQRLQDELLEPPMVAMITDAVTTEVKKTLSTQPSELKRLQAKRQAVATKLANLVQAIEQGLGPQSVVDQIAAREAERRDLDEKIAALAEPLDVDIRIIPTWVEQQLTNLSGLLAENPETDEGRPFLRVEGTGDLDALCGVRSLPSTTRTKLPFPILYLIARDRSPDRALIEY